MLVVCAGSGRLSVLKREGLPQAADQTTRESEGRKAGSGRVRDRVLGGASAEATEPWTGIQSSATRVEVEGFRKARL